MIMYQFSLSLFRFSVCYLYSDLVFVGTYIVVEYTLVFSVVYY